MIEIFCLNSQQLSDPKYVSDFNSLRRDHKERQKSCYLKVLKSTLRNFEK